MQPPFLNHRGRLRHAEGVVLQGLDPGDRTVLTEHTGAVLRRMGNIEHNRHEGHQCGATSFCDLSRSAATVSCHSSNFILNCLL